MHNHLSVGVALAQKSEVIKWTFEQIWDYRNYIYMHKCDLVDLEIYRFVIEANSYNGTTSFILQNLLLL